MWDAVHGIGLNICIETKWIEIGDEVASMSVRSNEGHKLDGLLGDLEEILTGSHRMWYHTHLQKRPAGNDGAIKVRRRFSLLFRRFVSISTAQRGSRMCLRVCACFFSLSPSTHLISRFPAQCGGLSRWDSFLDFIEKFDPRRTDLSRIFEVFLVHLLENKCICTRHERLRRIQLRTRQSRYCIPLRLHSR